MVLACSEGLLVAEERCAAPADEAGGVFRCASVRAGGLGDRQLVPYDSWLGHRPAEACAILPRGGDAGVDPLDDQLALILGEGGEHIQHQPTRRGRRVDTVRDGSDMDAAVAQQVHRVEHVDKRPAQPVDRPHDDGVALLGVLEEPFHSGPLDCRLSTRSHVGKNVALLHGWPVRCNQKTQLCDLIPRFLGAQSQGGRGECPAVGRSRTAETGSRKKRYPAP